MKYATIGIGVVLVLVVAGVIAYRISKSRQAAGGFRDWVKDPAYKKAAEDYFAAREALTVPDDISDADIRKMVNRLFVPKDDDFNSDRLKLVGAKAVPFLIEALRDPRTFKMRFEEGQSFATSPLERICDALEPASPPEAAGPLARFVDHEDEYFRQQAALALGNIGTSECIAPMLTALADKDDYVRSYAMMGIERGIRAKRCTDEFLNAMFPALAKLLDREDESGGGEAPQLLLAIDRERALATLLSPTCFTIENSEVCYVVRALNAAGHKIPHEKLLPLLKTAKPLIGKYAHASAYAEGLKAYGNNPDAAAEATLRAELKSPSKVVQEAASEALSILAGVSNARDHVFAVLDRVGFNSLSEPQKHYTAVLLFDGEVNNGGHAQYFVNSSGDHWKSALAGLNAVGAKERAEILQKAVSLFGPNGPSEDNDTRHEQLSRFSEEQDNVLDALNTEYYACKENINVLLAQYALQHKEHFRSRE